MKKLLSIGCISRTLERVLFSETTNTFRREIAMLCILISKPANPRQKSTCQKDIIWVSNGGRVKMRFLWILVACDLRDQIKVRQIDVRSILQPFLWESQKALLHLFDICRAICKTHLPFEFVNAAVGGDRKRLSLFQSSLQNWESSQMSINNSCQPILTFVLFWFCECTLFTPHPLHRHTSTRIWGGFMYSHIQTWGGHM